MSVRGDSVSVVEGSGSVVLKMDATSLTLPALSSTSAICPSTLPPSLAELEIDEERERLLVAASRGPSVIDAIGVRSLSVPGGRTDAGMAC